MAASKIVKLQDKLNRWYFETSRFYNIKPGQVTDRMHYLSLSI